MKKRHYSHAGACRGREKSPFSGRRLLVAGLLGSVLGGITPCTPLSAATLLHGRVVHITDAVSFSIATDDGRRVRVHLQGVLPPRRGAPAASARRALARLVFDHAVEVRGEESDREGLKGRVLRAGIDIAMQMVSDGWLRADGSDAVLATLERQARLARRGLWANAAD